MKRVSAILFLILLACSSFAGDFINERTACPSSGAKPLTATQTSLFALSVVADPSNSGIIYIGSSSVTSTTGIALNPGSSFYTSKGNAGITPGSLWFACSNSADHVFWLGSR